MIIGYARVSTTDQDTKGQEQVLRAAACQRIYREKASGGRWDRPELQRMLDHARAGDVIVVYKLDRLSRSMRDMLTLIDRLREAQVGFRSLTESIDTTTPAGMMFLRMVSCFAEYERDMLKERTKVGLAVARLEGRVGGRKPKLSSAQRKEVVTTVRSGTKTAADAARLFDVHPATICRLLARAEA